MRAAQARRLGLHDAAKAFAAERRTLQYYFKSTRPNDAVPRRCVCLVNDLPCWCKAKLRGAWWTAPLTSFTVRLAPCPGGAQRPGLHCAYLWPPLGIGRQRCICGQGCASSQARRQTGAPPEGAWLGAPGGACIHKPICPRAEPNGMLCASCRFVLQPGALPDGARLGAHLGRLRGRAAALEAAGAAGVGADLADVRVRVQERVFRYALPTPSVGASAVICTWGCWTPVLGHIRQDVCAPMKEPVWHVLFSLFC